MNEPNESDIEERVRAVIAKLFSVPANANAEDLRMGNPPAWDSIGHMELLVAVENEFKIRIPSHSIAALTTVESIVNAVRAHDGH